MQKWFKSYIDLAEFVNFAYCWSLGYKLYAKYNKPQFIAAVQLALE